MNSRLTFRNPTTILLLALTIWFAFAFLIFPNGYLLQRIFFPDGHLTIKAIDDLLSSARAMKSLKNSFILACTMVITQNAVGIFIVLVTGYFRIRGARILWLGFATTFVFGGVIAVAGYSFMYGPHGFITRTAQGLFPSVDPDWFTGAFAVIVVSTLTGTSLHLLFLGAALQKVDQQTIEAARVMGANQWQILTRVVLPTLKPVLFGITILTFLHGLKAFAAPLALGGDDFQTITPMILSFAKNPSARDLAATLALILGLATMALLVVLNKVEAGGTYFSVSKVASKLEKQRIGNPVANVVVHVVAYVLWAAYILPPLLVIVFSFTNAQAINAGQFSFSDFTLSNYITVLTDARALWPFLVSLGYASTTAIIVIVVLLYLARIIQSQRNWFTATLEYVLHIPWVLPSALIALGYIITFSAPHWFVGGGVLTGTVLILGVAYIVSKIPFTLRMLKAAYAGIAPSLEEAARMLGAKTWTVYAKILLPAVLPTALAITALNFNSLLDEYDDAVFLAHPMYQPLGIVIINATQSETSADQIALVFVYAVLLMAIASIVMWLVYGNGFATLTRPITGVVARRRSSVSTVSRVDVSALAEGDDRTDHSI